MSTRRARPSRAFAACLSLGLIMFGAGATAADGDAYSGRNINLIVSADAGTGYDIYARTIARHWTRRIPGNPTITVQNLVGAGGLTAANYLYNLAQKDGMTVGLVQPTVPYEPYFGNKQANFDPLKINWLGTPGQETATLMVWGDTGVRTLEDARKRTMTFAATGGASTLAFYARVIDALFDMPMKLIVGYKSQSEIFLSMERGEHEGAVGTFYSTIKTSKGDWLASGKLRLILQFGGAPNPELKGVPFAMDLISNPADKQLMEIASAPLALGRPMLAPPGVSADRLEVLRTSLMETFRDPAYLADCERQVIACDTPLSGQQIAAIISKSYGAPAEARARLEKIYAGTAK